MPVPHVDVNTQYSIKIWPFNKAMINDNHWLAESIELEAIENVTQEIINPKTGLSRVLRPPKTALPNGTFAILQEPNVHPIDTFTSVIAIKKITVI